MVLKKNKKSNVKPFMVKNHISVFVNALIENPAFDSQVRLFRRYSLVRRAANQKLSDCMCAVPVMKSALWHRNTPVILNTHRDCANQGKHTQPARGNKRSLHVCHGGIA